MGFHSCLVDGHPNEMDDEQLWTGVPPALRNLQFMLLQVLVRKASDGNSPCTFFGGMSWGIYGAVANRHPCWDQVSGMLRLEIWIWGLASWWFGIAHHLDLNSGVWHDRTFWWGLCQILSCTMIYNDIIPMISRASLVSCASLDSMTQDLGPMIFHPQVPIQTIGKS